MIVLAVTLAATLACNAPASAEPLTVPAPTPAPAPAATITPDEATATSPPTPTATTAPVVGPTPLETDPVPTATPDCRDPDGLLILVDHKHLLRESYVPPDLETLQLPPENTLRGGLRARKVIIAPLLTMLKAIREAGLGASPTVASAYRSYNEQRYTYEVALTEQPGRADFISAPPGHSEHQLGTSIDFGSWSLGNQFHTDFYTTPEGQWLAENSRQYGFVLSYPGWAEKETGYYFEPWHYRYVGVTLAQELGKRRITLIEYLREKEKRGCETGPS